MLATANTKQSLKMTQLDPLGNSFGMWTKNSSSFPVDIVGIELVSFVWGVELAVGGYKILNLGMRV